MSSDQLSDLLVDPTGRGRGVAALGSHLLDGCERVLDGFGLVVIPLFGFARHEFFGRESRQTSSTGIGQLDRLPEEALKVGQLP